MADNSSVLFKKEIVGKPSADIWSRGSINIEVSCYNRGMTELVGSKKIEPLAELPKPEECPEHKEAAK